MGFPFSGGSMRMILATCIAVHLTRIAVIPFAAWIAGSEDFTETEKLARSMGYKPTGPCSLPRPLKNCTFTERLHIILVSAQWDREPFTREETEAVLKSMLAATRCRIHYHFMVTGEEEDFGISEMMEKLGATPFDSEGPIAPRLVRHDNHLFSEFLSEDPDKPDWVDPDPQVVYTVHPIPVRFVHKKASALGINITHHSGAAGFSKLFLSEILWNIDRAIYLDVDLLFAEDIGNLWAYFKDMDDDEDLFLYMGDNHPTAYGPRARYPFCSCQLIMDFRRFRKQNFTRLVLEAFGEQKAMEVWGFRPGDQWVFTMMCMNNPEKCRVLPKIWNVSGCSKPRFLGLNARDRDQNGTCWKTLHFNCMGVRDGRYYALMNTDWEDSHDLIMKLPWNHLGRNLIS